MTATHSIPTRRTRSRAKPKPVARCPGCGCLIVNWQSHAEAASVVGCRLAARAAVREARRGRERGERRREVA
jgi:hypothetical protein